MMLKKIHNRLRAKYNLYHHWHNFNYHSQTHSLILAIFIVLILFIVSPKFSSQQSQPKQSTLAQTSNATLSTQTQWQAGTYDMATDLVSAAGDVKLFAEAEIDPAIGTWSTDGAGSLSSLYDGNTSTGVALDADEYILRDFGQTVSSITKYRIYFTGAIGTKFPGLCGKPKTPLAFSCGDLDGDGVEWLNYATFGNTNMEPDIWNDKPLGPSDHSKIRLAADDTYTITEYEFYFQPLTATHTSASTQIGATGETDRQVVAYESFAPTETEPASSDITYRFRRTNQAGSWTGNWTDYVDYTGTAIDLTTYSTLAITQTDVDEGKTYLQVETKFVRTDVSADPVVSDYTVNYHTNKAPSAPTPQ